jgi:hypothetical protein
MRIPIGEHGTRALEHSVHGSGEPRSKRLHSSSERVPVLRLHNQVRVISLKRVVHEPKLSELAPHRKASLELAHESHSAQRRDVFSNLERDVGGQHSAEALARAMPDHRIRSRLPSGSWPSPAMSHPIELELFRCVRRINV